MTSSQDPLPGDDPPADESGAPPQPPPPSPPPPPPPPPSLARRPRVSDQVLSIIGFVCAVVAVLYIPVLFGLAGVVLGIVGHTRGEPLGRWAAIAAGAAMLAGTMLSILLVPR
ncbi:hypothetical protein ACIBI7_19580 [Nonomuraea fuscirosea]|uniref:hypothetical protein n=1 Tax=Nonomuraea fuscirosea TaxID=1291556 RepID=UPI00379E57FB